MDNTIVRIKQFIGDDRLEDALEGIKELDEELYLSIKQQWKARTRDSLRGTGETDAEIRTFIAGQLLRYLEVWVNNASSTSPPLPPRQERAKFRMDRNSKQPGYEPSGHRHTYYYFIAERHLAFSNLHQNLQALAGGRKDTALLKTLRELSYELNQLLESLGTESSKNLELNQDIRLALQSCKTWKHAVLNQDHRQQARSSSKTLLLIFRIAEALRYKKDQIERLS